MIKNQLFKERLRDSGISIIAVVVILAVVAAIGVAFCLAMYGLNLLWKPLDDIIFGCLVGGYILYHVGKGIKWLFIDPFRKDKEDKEELED
jgi:hypothetical protein